MRFQTKPLKRIVLASQNEPGNYVIVASGDQCPNWVWIRKKSDFQKLFSYEYLALCSLHLNKAIYETEPIVLPKVKKRRITYYENEIASHRMIAEAIFALAPVAPKTPHIPLVDERGRAVPGRVFTFKNPMPKKIVNHPSKGRINLAARAQDAAVHKIMARLRIPCDDSHGPDSNQVNRQMWDLPPFTEELRKQIMDCYKKNLSKYVRLQGYPSGV